MATNGYCTLDQVRSHLGYKTTETSNNAGIDAAIDAASRLIDAHCGRRFWQDGTVVTREFWAYSPRCVEVDDISTTTGLVVKIDDDGDGTFETTLTITTDFFLIPANAADRVPVWPYEEVWLADNYSFPRLSNGRPGVQVTAKFGWPAVPDDVEFACIIQAAQLFKAKEAIFGAIALGESASRLIPAIDRQALALLADYRKPAIG
jgi:hypothetical protein